MSFLLGVVCGIILTIAAIIIWWYRDAGLVTGILDDDIIMQRPASDWSSDGRKEG